MRILTLTSCLFTQDVWVSERIHIGVILLERKVVYVFASLKSRLLVPTTIFLVYGMLSFTTMENFISYSCDDMLAVKNEHEQKLKRLYLKFVC